MKQKIILIILAAVVVIGGIYWYTTRNQATAPENTNTEALPAEDEEEFVGDVPGDAPDTANVPTSATIAISTQLPGDSLTIDNVFLDNPGFVSIHEVDAKGQPGTLVGNTGLLGSGARQDLEVMVNLKPGAKYIAQLRTDNGDKKFNAASDAVVKKDNLPVMTMFSVSQ